MPRRSTTALAVVLALLSGACRGEPTGQPVPDAPLETFAGDATSVHAYLGEPMIVNFWASWCAPCVREMPDFQRVSQEYEGRVRFLGIDTQDGVVPAQRLLDETGVTYDVVRDPDAAAFRAFGIIGMPSTFVVGPDGVLLARHTGPLTADELRALIEEHLVAAAVDGPAG